jgi:hypothetical protein
MTMSRIGIIGSLRTSPLSAFLGWFVIALQLDVKTPITMHLAFRLQVIVIPCTPPCIR